MTKQNTWIRWSVLAVLALVPACGAAGGAAGGEPAEPEPDAAAVPAGLEAVESAAEDAYDDALAGRSEAVAARASKLQDRWDALRSRMAADGAGAGTLRSMDTAVAGLASAVERGAGRLEVARAANAVGAPVAELFAVYHPPVPASVLRLDYLGREVALDAMESSHDAASAHVDELASTWEPLRGRVREAGGARVAEAFDDSVRTMRESLASGNDATLRRAAERALELVDGMERVLGA